MKHAYLIIAHHEFDLLQTLVKMLDTEANDLYIHVDNKVLRSDFEALNHLISNSVSRAKVYFLKDRVSVYWGDYSQVQCELLLFQTASKHFSYDYYHLISGVDLPIQSQEYIQSFFEQHKGKEFIGFSLGKSDVYDCSIKTRYYYFFTRWRAFRLMNLLDRLSVLIQKVLRVNRKRDISCFKGAGWVSVTDAFVRYLLSQEPFIKRYFRWCLCADEIYKQTVCMNSSFKEHVNCIEDEYKSNMREIDWNRGYPYVWKITDFDMLCQSKKLFARKFSSVDLEIVKKIQEKFAPREII